MTKKTYSKPEITAFSLKDIFKYQKLSFQTENFDEIDGVKILELVKKYGTPLYVISEKTLRETTRRFVDTFRSFYPKTILAYSYKTNYLSTVCAIMHTEGCWAEVVSGFEYNIARDLGVSGDKIIFNGPVKLDDELIQAIENNSIINIDSFTELERIKEIARRFSKPVNVGIRVNMKLNYPPWDKFGFNYETGQAYKACKEIMESDTLNLTGFHIHSGTFITDLSIYRNAMEALISLALRCESELNANIEYLDIGGGYASTNTLHTQFLRGEATNPTFEEYAEVTAGILSLRKDQFKKEPILFLEAGRAVVDPSMSLITKVMATKKFASGLKGVILDIGVNVLPTAYWYKHEMQLISPEKRPYEMLNILGGLCMNIDVLALNAYMPSLRYGDILRVKNVGAYNFSQSMQFIYPRPPIVLISNGEIFTVREGENIEYIRKLEKLPPHLINDDTKNSMLNKKE